MEASNKYAKVWALAHARKSSMENNNIDVFKRFHHQSDPIVQTYLYKDKLKKRSRSEGYPKPVIDMMKSSEQVKNLWVAPATPSTSQHF